jgi:hypothetical protein
MLIAWEAGSSGKIAQSKEHSDCQIRNPKHEARNKSQILILQCSKRNCANGFIQGFGHLDLENLNLFRI